MGGIAEWTFEGGPELFFMTVVIDGFRIRYQRGIYVSI